MTMHPQIHQHIPETTLHQHQEEKL